MTNLIRVTVWNEGRHEKHDPAVAKVYPDGIHGAITQFLQGQPGIEARTATLDEPDHGLSDEAVVDLMTAMVVSTAHVGSSSVAEADRVPVR